ncbi:MAG: hypothetical protein NUV80_04145 [Candidatus Berkelbacteria bacterium]|nr:hypothetical protein [Candidatus Berkelbacteria bacterium]MCR4307730.1 hypothetical protein [Candidatus Berkelbacteria bacterium]
MPKDRIYEKLLRHDRQLSDIKTELSDVKTELKDDLQNFRLAVMEALDKLVIASDRMDQERLVATYRIDTLDERVNQHDKEIAQLKTKR